MNKMAIPLLNNYALTYSNVIASFSLAEMQSGLDILLGPSLGSNSSRSSSNCPTVMWKFSLKTTSVFRMSWNCYPTNQSKGFVHQNSVRIFSGEYSVRFVTKIVRKFFRCLISISIPISIRIYLWVSQSITRRSSESRTPTYYKLLESIRCLMDSEFYPDYFQLTSVMEWPEFGKCGER